jgi:hypothetical protein
LDHTHPQLERIAALTRLPQPLLDAPGVMASFPKMLLKHAAIAALRRHRDLRLKLAHQSQLGGVSLVEVPHDLLLLLLTQDFDSR